MNTCPDCCEERTLLGSGGNYGRPRLFNWITILLVTAWVVLVGVVAESTQAHGPRNAEAPSTFVQSLAK